MGAISSNAAAKRAAKDYPNKKQGITVPVSSPYTLYSKGMLKRQYRLKDRRVFRSIYRRGQAGRAADLTVFSQPNRLGRNRVAVVVSTKVSKKAVRRNRIRRRLHGLMEGLWPTLSSGYDILIVVKADISRSPQETISRQLLLALSQAGLLGR